MTDITTATTASNSAAAPSDTKNSVKTASRYAGVVSLGSVGVFMFLGTFSPEQQTQILHSANIMYTSLQAFVGAAADIWFIVFPVIAIWLGKMGIDSGKIDNVVNRVFDLAKAGNLEAKVALVNAASSPAIGTQALVNPELAPLPSTAGNVVATPAAVSLVVPQNPAPPTP